jgi:hypothetical protein
MDRFGQDVKRRSAISLACKTLFDHIALNNGKCETESRSLIERDCISMTGLFAEQLSSFRNGVSLATQLRPSPEDSP